MPNDAVEARAAEMLASTAKTKASASRASHALVSESTMPCICSSTETIPTPFIKTPNYEVSRFRRRQIADSLFDKHSSHVKL
jgi:hypothetical protein